MLPGLFRKQGMLENGKQRALLEFTHQQAVSVAFEAISKALVRASQSSAALPRRPGTAPLVHVSCALAALATKISARWTCDNLFCQCHLQHSPLLISDGTWRRALKATLFE